ncbi:MAG TPA: serine/threonine-protein kinase [Kofleriaceae bacterium]|nr:serine/threonine-protein kinase [Kofleriaceae bacterium]
MREPDPSKPARGLADTELPVAPDAELARGSAAGPPNATLTATADASGPQPRESVRTGTIGRFTLLAPLGKGGMGEVHAAYDPELDRKVAVKLLRGGEGSRASEARARLLREARAMARLSHANAITVFEAGQVEVGGEPQVYLAMELVEGGTFGRWMRKRRRPWREILPVACAAGRGLEAAHAAGMVHRDFKPDNVLVGEHGEVKVTDFGLAALVGLPTPDGDEPLSGSSGRGGIGADTPLDKLTRTGHWVGTPYYMAPEQHRGGAVDARSDQFAFCVTLWEALFGERPFTGRSYEELRAAVDAGRIREPRRDSRVPGWLERALRRGLSVDPAARHPSMTALLGLLDRGLRRRRRALLGGAVAAVAMAGALGVAWGLAGGGTETAPEPCTGAERHLDGVWDGGARATVRAGLERAQPALAAESWPRVDKALTDYAGGWADMHRRACEATRVYGEETEDQLDLRMRCLDRRRDELQATVSLLAGADPGVAARAVSIAGSLAPVSGCGDAAALKTGVVLDEAGKARAAAIERGLAEQVVAFRAGRYAESLAPTRALLEQARALGHRPLEAELLLQLAELQMRDRTASSGSVDSYNAAASAALAAGQDALAARAWASLIYDLSGQERYVEADRAADLARSALERIGGDDTIQSIIDNNVGVSFFDRGDRARAETYLLRAIATRERLLGPDDPRVAGPIDNLASVYSDDGDLVRSTALYQRALAIRERGLGPNHPDVGTTLNNLGIDYRKLGRLDQARAMLERAVRVRATALGADHPLVGNALVNLAAAYSSSGDWQRCIATGARAVTVYETRSRTTLGAGHAAIEGARCQRYAGRPAAALPLTDYALGVYRHLADGKPSHSVRNALREQARALAALGRRGEAAARLAATVADEDADKLAADDPERAPTLAELGMLAMAGGNPGRARDLLERALTLWDRDPEPKPLAGGARLALARVLWAQGGDDARRRARAQVDKAVIDFGVGDADSVFGLRDARAWLAAHQP